MAENLSVSWDDYEKNICKGLSGFQQRGEFADMTLAADGHHVKVHKMVMSLVSPFIKELISAANCPHPVLFLNKVSYSTMQSILEYAYTGEVVIRKDLMGEFLEACKDLHIKGLENMLKDAQNKVSTIFNVTRDYQSQDIWNEPDQSSSRKRKKSQHEETKVEMDNFVDDSDFDQSDVYEVQVETSPGEGEDLKKSTVESLKFKENAPKKPVALQYSVSCQGNLQIVLNRYMYALRHIRKNDERFWRCISQQKTGCPAIVTTLEETIKQRSFPHNHPFHDAQILKRTKNGNIFTSVNEGETAATEKKQKREETNILAL